jgi:hypothetical protein
MGPNFDIRVRVTDSGNRVSPAEVIALRKESEEVLGTARGNIMDVDARKKIAKEIAEQIGTSEEEIVTALVPAWNKALSDLFRAQKAEQAAEAERPRGPAPPPDRRQAARALIAKTPPHVVAYAEAMLRDPELIRRIGEDIAAVGVAGEAKLALTVYLIGTSRKLPSPLSSIIIGPSSSGKTFTIETVGTMMPDEETIFATSMSREAMYHMQADALKNALIVAGERSHRNDPEQFDSGKPLREMIGTGRLTKLIAVRNEDGEIETRLIVQDGPISHLETTTKEQIHEEDRNRNLLLHTDETEEQTEAVLTRLAECGAGEAPCENVRAVLEVHHTLQRLLEPTPVVIPYATDLVKLFPKGRVEARRAFSQLVSMVKVLTLLHQYQRSKDGKGRLIATKEDYLVAYDLLAEPLGYLLGGNLSEATKRFFDRLKKAFAGHDQFTSSEVRRVETTSKSAVNSWLGELREAGLVAKIVEAKGKPTVWKLTGREVPASQAVLPKPEEVFKYSPLL